MAYSCPRRTLRRLQAKGRLCTVLSLFSRRRTPFLFSSCRTSFFFLEIFVQIRKWDLIIPHINHEHYRRFCWRPHVVDAPFAESLSRAPRTPEIKKQEKSIKRAILHWMSIISFIFGFEYSALYGNVLQSETKPAASHGLGYTTFYRAWYQWIRD